MSNALHARLAAVADRQRCTMEEAIEYLLRPSVQLPEELYERVERLGREGLNGTPADAIAWLMNPGMVRVAVTPGQAQRWKSAANANGQNIGEFVAGRVEAALMYGSDPGTLRRIHDMIYSLVRAQGLIPNPSTPGADKQVIAALPR